MNGPDADNNAPAFRTTKLLVDKFSIAFQIMLVLPHNVPVPYKHPPDSRRLRDDWETPRWILNKPALPLNNFARPDNYPRARHKPTSNAHPYLESMGSSFLKPWQNFHNPPNAYNMFLDTLKPPRFWDHIRALSKEVPFLFQNRSPPRRGRLISSIPWKRGARSVEPLTI